MKKKNEIFGHSLNYNEIKPDKLTFELLEKMFQEQKNVDEEIQEVIDNNFFDML